MPRVTLVLKTNEGGLWVVPQLVALRETGVGVTAVLPPGPGRLRRALDRQGIAVAETPFDFRLRPGPRTAIGLLRLRRLIGETRPDVVFYHLYASALATRLATLRLHVPRVHMVAGPLYLESPVIRTAERLLMHLDTRLIAGSGHTADRYRELGMPDERLRAVPYGVDLEHFRPRPADRAPLRTTLGLGDDHFVVVMVAYVYAPKSRVFPGVGVKGHEVLLQAWPQVVEAEPRARLVLVGHGFDAEGERHRRSLVERFALDNDPTVTWLDSVDDVRPYYAAADLSVSPSLSENHGAALEASAMGVPSVVSDAGALPEAVTPDSGWVVAAGSVDALAVALLTATAARRAGTLADRGGRARAHVRRRFDRDRAVAAVRDVVLDVVHVPDGPDERARVRVAAFCEQRGWTATTPDGAGAVVLGRTPLALVAALSERADVELGVRVGQPEPGGSVLAPGARAVPLVSGGTGLRASVLELARNAARVVAAVRRSDVVYADQPGVVGGLALVTGRLARRPLVVNVVGDPSESVVPDVVPGLRGQVAHRLLPAVQRWAARRAAVTNFVTAEALQRRYPPTGSTGPGRSFAISTARALAPRPDPRPAPDLAAARAAVSLVTVASLEQPYKGVDELTQAVGLLAGQGMDVRLTVVGEGRLRERLREAAEHHAPGRVTFTGHLYAADLLHELRRHEVFVLASWTEGLPRALVEAMADGMACVATAVGGVPELLEPHRTVAPRDPAALADALAALVADPDAWRRSVRHNLEAADRVFDRRDGVDDLVGAVLDVARPRRRAAT
ncbi:glycosyltransferase [Terracoccus luteus]|uniref:Glycosyltransferase involved in cell wall biosynthesis n=1 Tax=Terracoccus luteus TaxID=53356 RepID=A0A839PXC5_9MICO|nr:glycosyltransferase [Terracoccus luteus]MBB2987374.1 glycosyltransferase involved in cell wall biosynthesis [Terracoccus luteus]MCP2173025.1 glycosyltransferase involved in cell wall biosynthesis [Terracoccus luteus]